MWSVVQVTKTHLAISNAGQHVDMCTAPKLQDTSNVIVKTEQAAPHIKALFCLLYRHERQVHPIYSPRAEPVMPSPAEDCIYNYRRGKLAHGLVLLEFNDAIKEGDGERIFDIYKMALLLYKVGGHYKYAYVALLYLVKIAAVLPASSAHNLKWNRFCNKHGGKGKSTRSITRSTNGTAQQTA